MPGPATGGASHWWTWPLLWLHQQLLWRHGGNGQAGGSASVPGNFGTCGLNGNGTSRCNGTGGGSGTGERSLIANPHFHFSTRASSRVLLCQAYRRGPQNPSSVHVM